MTCRALLPLFFLSACPSADDTVDTADVDTSSDDIDIDTVGVQGPACEAVQGESFPSRRVDGGSWTCSGAECTMRLPASEPTRGHARVHAWDQMMVLDAYESPELLVAGAEGVYAVTVPSLSQFHAGGGRVWLLIGETVFAMDTTGVITQRCEVPEDMTSVAAMGFVAGRLFVNGRSEAGGSAWMATDEGWEPVVSEAAAWNYREYAADQLFILGYGYAAWVDLTTGDQELLGGSDDDFSRVAVCDDGTYWIGGMTGRVMHCTAEHDCGYVESDTYPFQSEATGCDAQGRLWWLEQPRRGRLTEAGEVTYEAMPDGMRTGTEQSGRRWTVVDGD